MTLAFIFDLDGVLWDTTSLHADAFTAAFTGEGLQAPDYPTLAGRHSSEAVCMALTAQGKPVEDVLVQKLVSAKQKFFRTSLKETPPDVSIATHVLKKLSRDHPLVLASSASRVTVDHFLDLSGTRSLFKETLSGDDVKRAKPDPEIYVKAQTFVPTCSSYVVEDTIAGIKAARAAGLEVIGLTKHSDLPILQPQPPDRVPRAKMYKAGVVHCISNLHELLVLRSQLS